MPAAVVWSRYGICSMTLSRWLKNPALGFPKPIYFGRYRYWRLADLQEFERSRVTASAA
ncbi:DNA-binding protein [Hyphomicrobium sp. 1Nfss2.1]|uniref:DNA-binding protein n=1 Tax=Hyphomicrobium sp. 1Nfss2.1 TaxID=3413936 RepID=UPI003C7E82D3